MSKLSIKHIYHKGLERPMRPIVVAGDHKYVIQTIRDPGHEGEIETRIVDIKEICLDPGGMLIKSIPFVSFEINGIPFSVQYTKTGIMLEYVKANIIRVPGYARIITWYYDLFIPEEIVDGLVSKLTELYKSDEEMHYKLDEYEILENVEKNTIFRSRNLPRE